MIWYTEKQLETAWKIYFKVCNSNMITPLTIDEFRPIYEHICAQAMGRYGGRVAIKFKKFISKEKEKDICKMCGDIKSKCTGYKCWIR